MAAVSECFSFDTVAWTIEERENRPLVSKERRSISLPLNISFALLNTRVEASSDHPMIVFCSPKNKGNMLDVRWLYRVSMML